MLEPPNAPYSQPLPPRSALVRRLIGGLLILAGVAFVVVMMLGCQAGTKGRYTGKFEGTVEVTIEHKQDGTPIIKVASDSHRVTDQSANVVAPKDAKEAPTINLGDGGIATSGGAAFAPAVVTSIQRNSKLFYIGGMLCLGLAAFLFFVPFAKAWPGSGGMAIGAGAMAALLFVLPSGIEKFGWQAAAGAFAIIVVAVGFWVWGQWKGQKKRDEFFKARGDNAAAQLMAKSHDAAKQGDTAKATDLQNSAIAAERTANPAFDASFKEAHGASTAKDTTPPPTTIEPPTSSLTSSIPSRAAPVWLTSKATSLKPVAKPRLKRKKPHKRKAK